jgi:hypothetical protein
MLSRLHRPAHRADMNWAPLSDVMVVGTPNCDTQPAKRSLAQSAAVMDDSGMASSNLEVRSIIVKGRCGRGLTRSTWNGRNGGEVPVSLLVVGGRVCELCPAGSTSRPWPLELWPWPSVASRIARR